MSFNINKFIENKKLSKRFLLRSLKLNIEEIAL